MCSCCVKGIARWLIGIVSICVIICGVVAATVVYKKEKDRDWVDLIKNNVPFFFIFVAMACAIVSSVIGFLLCCCKKKCLYVTYLIIIVLVIIIEIVAIVLAFCYKDKIIDGIDENWPKDKYKETRLKIEEKMECCGFKKYDIEYGVICGYKGVPAPKCKDKIVDEINSNMKDLKIATIFMAAVEVVLLVCAIYLVCSSKSD